MNIIPDIFSAVAYDQASGEFTWATTRSNRAVAGKPAGHIAATGYLTIRYNRKQYQAHRLAWFISHGVWPDGEIDHINGDRLDNRLANLRDVFRRTNAENERRARKNSKSAVLGVKANGKKFIARLMVNRVEHYLGTFETPEAAHSAYLVAKREKHAGCTL